MSHKPPTVGEHPTEITGTHRGVIHAQHPGRRCLCTDPIEQGQAIVKRWGRWIHLDCDDDYSDFRQPP